MQGQPRRGGEDGGEGRPPSPPLVTTHPREYDHHPHHYHYHPKRPSPFPSPPWGLVRSVNWVASDSSTPCHKTDPEGTHFVASFGGIDSTQFVPQHMISPQGLIHHHYCCCCCWRDEANPSTSPGGLIDLNSTSSCTLNTVLEDGTPQASYLPTNLPTYPSLSVSIHPLTPPTCTVTHTTLCYTLL